MDSKLFRLPTKPNFYAGVASASPFDIEQRQKHTQLPTSDSRYPGWAAPMADGRLVTSYQNHCSRNVPTGKQFATKEWMTKNASELIRINRERYSLQTGAVWGLDPTVPAPAAAIRTCTRQDCRLEATGEPGGIGTERGDGGVPELFGTWAPRATEGSWAPEAEFTRVYEGGRNTPRGMKTVPGAQAELR